MSEHIISVFEDGTVQFIYNDELRPLLDIGDARIERASHVEPGDPTKGQDALKWYADMHPVGGPVLGSFDTREQALAEEVSWIEANVLSGAAA
jgi:hypothetical protein